MTEEEAESVFLDKQLILTWSFHTDSCEKRLIAIGRSKLNRHLLLVFTVRGNRIRVISARGTSEKEMQKYEEKADTT